MSGPGSETLGLEAAQAASDSKQRWLAVGGIAGAILASSCCIVPLLLFSVGIGGAWIGNLAVLAPYQPIFIAMTFGILGYGFYLAYWKSGAECAAGTYCASPSSGRVVKSSLWVATILVLAASAFPFVAPYLLQYY